MPIICNALARVSERWFQIGIQLGIPREKLDSFKNEVDPMSAVINYWLNGNVIGSEISWRTIAGVLRAPAVGEIGLATELRERYCQQSTIKGQCKPWSQEPNFFLLAIVPQEANFFKILAIIHCPLKKIFSHTHGHQEVSLDPCYAYAHRVIHKTNGATL